MADERSRVPSVGYRKLCWGVQAGKASNEKIRIYGLNKLRNCINAEQYNKWIEKYVR